MNRSQIIGTGHHLPERVVTNKELEDMIDTSDEWIRERTGIERRRYFDPEKDTPTTDHDVSSLRNVVYAISMCNKHDLWLGAIKV